MMKIAAEIIIGDQGMSNNFQQAYIRIMEEYSRSFKIIQINDLGLFNSLISLLDMNSNDEHICESFNSRIIETSIHQNYCEILDSYHIYIQALDRDFGPALRDIGMRTVSHIITHAALMHDSYFNTYDLETNSVKIDNDTEIIQTVKYLKLFYRNFAKVVSDKSANIGKFLDYNYIPFGKVNLFSSDLLCEIDNLPSNLKNKGVCSRSYQVSPYSSALLNPLQKQFLGRALSKYSDISFLMSGAEV